MAPPPGQGQQQPGQQQPQQPGQGGLPPTGIQQQMASLQGFYGQVQAAQAGGQHIGFNPYQMQQQQGIAGGGAGGGGQVGQAMSGVGGQGGMGGGMMGGSGQVNIQQLARNLASRYGLSMGRGELVDPQGNFLMTPEQLSAASGGQTTMGMAAAKMNYIAQAVSAEQNRQQQRLGRAAIGTGLGLVQSRGRGSAAAMQSGFYQDLADLYSNEEYEAADFSYFIEEERFRIANELERRKQEAEKKGGIGGALGSILGGVAGAIFGGAPGAGIGSSLGGGLGEMIGGFF